MNATEKITKIRVAKTSVVDLVLDRVYLLSRRRIAWLRTIWEEAVADNNGKAFNYHAEIDTCLANRDSPLAESWWIKNEKNIESLNQEIEKKEQTLLADNQSRLAQLKNLFKLGSAESDTIQCCLALAIDPNLERVYAYLQDNKSRGYVTGQLVTRLFGHGRTLPLPSSSPLLRYRMIREAEAVKGEPARLYCDPYLLDWLLGSNEIDPKLSGFAKWQPVHVPLAHWPVEAVLATLKNLLLKNKLSPIRAFIAGQSGSGRRTFAAAVCEQLGVELLSIDADRIDAQDWASAFIYAQRQSLLFGCALLWHGRAAIEKLWPNSTVSGLPHFITGETDESPVPGGEMIDVRFEIPAMPMETGIRIFKQLIPAASRWSQDDLIQLFRRQQPVIGQLATASKKSIGSVADASEALKSANRQRLGDLASLLSSGFGWEDLIIPASLRNNLNDFYFEATERLLVWESQAAQRLFPQGRGLLALFTGMPGTGKTMAAQVIANSLGLDLFRVDLSSLISKYIGETSKNIERILSRAKQMDIVLLFDEADALFSKRTEIKDSHDRYANTDTNYLLQAIEEYPGIVVLASNRKANIDSGFTRRLRYVLEFPKPDAQHRLELWRRLLTEISGPANTAILDKELAQLAPALELTGAQIKSSVLSAIFLARRDKTSIAIAHLLRGVERELAKENRGLGRYGQELLKQIKL